MKKPKVTCKRCGESSREADCPTCRSRQKGVPYTYMDPCCMICDRDWWAPYSYLGNGKWRHEDCFPGSESWRIYYAKLPKEKRSVAGDLLFYGPQTQL